MDGGAATAAIEVVIQNLINVSKKEISLIRGVEKDAEKLKKNLALIQSFLDDAQKKLIAEDAVKTWLKYLEAVAFDADNVLDDLNYHLLSKSIQTEKKKKVPSCCFPSFNRYVRRRQTAIRIKEINTTFESINNKASKLSLVSRLADATVAADYAASETNSFTLDPIFIGRDNDVSEIVKMLTTCSSEQVFSILPIVGMGGLGKTTLTRNVFHHEHIKAHFGQRIWVHVPKILDPVSLLKQILTTSTSQKVEVESSEVILKNLQQLLKTKTYLLVLDNVWNEDGHKWEEIINSLSGITSMKGNGIIVTTRNTEVASIVRTLPIYELRGLPKDSCWSLIKSKAFGEGDIPPAFETIGREIAKRCQGLPLAANVVGRVLRGKSEDDWLSIKDHWLSDVGGHENNISKILKLSFDHLPSPSLKRCFAYCSIFPKGEKMDKQKLIELWMAERFLQLDQTSDMDTVGNKFFNILLQNSLLQVAETDDYLNVTHCSMHDLVHDLACSVLGRGYYGFESSVVSKEKAKCLRTLFYEGEISDLMFSEFKSLHALTLRNNEVEELPDSIRELIHLRYFDISEARVKCLPDSISKLCHLQTLRASPERLPSTITYLINLRHLHVPETTELPPHLGRLTSLQTLPFFKVRNEEGHQLIELGNLKNIKGELKIHNLENVQDEEEAKKACLYQKADIARLELRWDESRESEINDENVLEGLQPHPDLKMLEIFGFKGITFPPWTLKMTVQDEVRLNNLTEIRLENCSECRDIPMLGHLQRLEYVYLCGLRNVKSIGPSFYGVENCSSSSGRVFPVLKLLELSDMPNLTEWVQVEFPSAKVFPCLEYLEMKNCKQLRSAPTQFSCSTDLDSGIKLRIKINGLDELECLPERLFYNNQKLSELRIKECPKLRELPDGLHTLNSLQVLKIKECPNLKSIPYSGQSQITPQVGNFGMRGS